MKFTIEVKTLKTVFKYVSRVIQKNNTETQKNNISISVSNDNLIMTLTNNLLTVKYEVKLDGQCYSCDAGEVNVDFFKFKGIVDKLNSETLDLVKSEDGTELSLTSNRSKFTLKLIEFEEYPVIDIDGEYNTFKISKKTLLTLIDKTLFAAAKNDVRFFLNGLSFNFNNGYLNVAGTDGYTLSYIKTELDCEQDNFNFIIPNKTLDDVCKMLPLGDEEITINFNNGKIEFLVSDFLSITSILIEGVYPNYLDVIPGNGNLETRVNKLNLKEALISAKFLSNSKYKGVKLEILNNSIKISSKNEYQDKSIIDVDAEYVTYKGDNFDGYSFGINADYLLNALTTIDTDDLLIINNAAIDYVAILIKPTDAAADAAADNAFEHKIVIMSMRLDY
jgi:DNA polymerase-3 subunit beta